MKYFIPIAIDSATAAKLLGTLPPTASATRNALAAKVDEIIKNYEPTVETAESEDAPTPKKSTRKTTKKSDA